MMRNLLFLFLVLLTLPVLSQKFISEKSKVSFFSDAAIEDIDAINTKATSIFNSATSEIVYSIPVVDFRFDKALMQEHFNEKYLESEKYPKATFQGKLVDFHSQTEGTQQVKAQGKLTIHGVTKEVEIPGTVEFTDKKMVMRSKFFVVLEDYKIMRPEILLQKIAEQVEVSVEFTYKPL